MENTSESPEKRQEAPKPDEKAQHKKRLFGVVDETLWEISWLRPILAFVVEEGRAVKHGWVALLVICGFCFFLTHHFEKGARERVESERDKYYVALQPWQALAASIYTNAPPDQRVSLLLSNITEMQNDIKRMAQKADYIEGTRTSSKVLQDLFPYGYTIYWKENGHTSRYRVFTTGLTEWDMDWDKVGIEVDVAKGDVHWTLPEVRTTKMSSNPQHGIEVYAGHVETTTSFKAGAYNRTGTYIRNEPVLHVITIGDNQRTPVFAIGMRIVPDPELYPRLPQK